jgi:hydrogenase/urease accessory protein HupE
MKSLRRLALVSVGFLAPLAAFAHPGHDGPHDFEWDFDHLVEHPAATLACFAIVALGGWAIWKLLGGKRPEDTKR